MDYKALLPDLAKRIGRIKKAIAAAGADAVLLADTANLFYTAGRVFRGYTYIPSAEHAKPVYFVIRPVGIDTEGYVYIRKPEQIPDELRRMGMPTPSCLGLELDQLSYSDAERLRKVFDGTEICNISQLMRRMRMVKTPFEIELMKEDGVHQATVYNRIRHLYKEDMTDLELQAEIERVLRLEGNLGYYRTYGDMMEINMGSVLAGDNADMPTPYDFAVGGGGISEALPVGANGTILHNGMTVMVDMNGCFNGYQTDLTRVWSIGDISSLAVKAHNASRRILRTLEKEALPGVPVAELYHRAMNIVEEEGLEDYFMGHTQKSAFIGHGVGIELNELPVITPRSKDILEEGTVLAIEPKFVIPGTGAAGVENTYVVRRDGLECITPYPEEIEEL